jgi:hypothetical protein
MRLNFLPGLSYDPAEGPVGMNVNSAAGGTLFTMRNVAVTSGGGALGFGPAPGGYYNNAANLSGANSYLLGSVSDIGGIDGNLTVECFVDMGQSTWDQLMAAGDGERFCPVVSALASSDGSLAWSLGFGSWIVASANGASVYRVVVPVMYQDLTADSWFKPGIQSMLALGPPITFRPGRFVHIAGCRKAQGVDTLMGCWFDGQSGLYAVSEARTKLPTATAFGVKIGGAAAGMQGVPRATFVESVAFTGAVDELRVTAAARYADRVAAVMNSLPEYQRVIPWPDY